MTQPLVQPANLQKIRNDFIGLDTHYTLADGRHTRRVYLDSTASTLMMGVAYRAMTSFLDHYANSHSLLHFSAKITTRQYLWAHNRILSFLGADPEEYACFFTGSGATAGLNRMARVLRDYRPNRDTVLVSLMEHHSNDLPHRKHAGKVVHIPLDTRNGDQPGCLNLAALEEELKRHKNHVNYVAVTGVSNVTGIINPIHQIAELVHQYDALILVDGAQMVAHLPVQLGGYSNQQENIDAFVFSGHKTYVPGSPGVVVCRKAILEAIEPEEVGGGMVEAVSVENYEIKTTFPDREEAGTPNIPGAIALGAALEVLDQLGMETLSREEDTLLQQALEAMQTIPGIMIYGETDLGTCPRAGSISFNLQGMHHGLTAAILNDYFNIAVRNECFCAHPYVKEMILDDIIESFGSTPDGRQRSQYKLIAGMVRASFGLYNTSEDVETLVAALQEIAIRKEEFSRQYRINEQGDYVHRTFRMEDQNHFHVNNFVQDQIGF